MSQEQHQVQTHKQNFFLTQQRLQLLHLMHLPSFALEEYIRNELEENPALEEGSDSDKEDELFSNEDKEVSENSFEEIEQFFYDDEIPDYKTYSNNFNKDEEIYSAPVIYQKSFQEELKDQVAGMSYPDDLRPVIEYLIDSLEGDGYLRRPIEDLTDDYGFANNAFIEENKIEEAIKILQQCEPSGVGARSLQECLLLQLQRKNKNKEEESFHLAETLLREYFHELTVKNFDKILKTININAEQLKMALTVISHLSPRPLADISRDVEKSQNITPEFIITSDGNSLEISLVNNPSRSIKVNSKIEDLVSEADLAAHKKESVSYIRKKIYAAKWFVDALREREKTLLAIMHAIVKIQRNFFESGDNKTLKPMILQDIAEMTGYDISTVSRATSNKYAQTGFGNVLLKNLFSVSLTSVSGEEKSTKEIQQVIYEIVQNENKAHPLNDFEIVDLLKEKGFIIARRTVVKYREAMNLPNARLRKEMV